MTDNKSPGNLPSDDTPAARPAFTLIELLVVIAIIAILAALLLPVLSAARNRAHMVTDLNNNRQTMMGVHMYSGDNNDCPPQPGWGTTVDCWAAAANIPLGGSASLYDTVYPQQLDWFTRGQLYNYIKTQKIMMCPADKPTLPKFKQRQIYTTSYVWNGALIGYINFGTSSNAWPRTFKLTTQFKPDCILQWEADENGSLLFWNDFSNFPDQGLSGRHGKGAVVGVFDGSSQRMPTNMFIVMAGGVDNGGGGSRWRFAQPPTPNQLWCSPINNGHGP